MKPMLASPVGEDIHFPVMVSPKYDGVRALVVDGVVVGRSLKPIPNAHVQKLFGRKEYNGFDGELIVGPTGEKDVFQQTTSGVMTKEGKPDVVFFVFDTYLSTCGFNIRQMEVSKVLDRFKGNCIIQVRQELVKTMDEMSSLENYYLALGYEGLMLRDPNGPYKFGRSTTKEGWLLKLKRFEDSEARIIGYTALQSNTNEAKVNELGAMTRSSHKAGKVIKQTLGSLQVVDTETGVEFSIGSGFTEWQRDALWTTGVDLIGQIVKYKFQPTGVKNKPRFPVFLGIRNPIDLSIK